MTTAALKKTAAPPSKIAASRRAARDLASLAVGESALVASVDVDGHAGTWLDAVGIAAGERVRVLRRAPFGGPLHIRTGAGGEFALCRSLARAIALVASNDAQEAAAE